MQLSEAMVVSHTPCNCSHARIYIFCINVSYLFICLFVVLKVTHTGLTWWSYLCIPFICNYKCKIPHKRINFVKKASLKQSSNLMYGHTNRHACWLVIWTSGNLSTKDSAGSCRYSTVQNIYTEYIINYISMITLCQILYM